MVCSNSARWMTPASMLAQSAASISRGSSSSDQGRDAGPASGLSLKTLCVTPSSRMRCATWATRRSRSAAVSCSPGAAGRLRAKPRQAGRRAPWSPRSSSQTPASGEAARLSRACSAAADAAGAASKGSWLWDWNWDCDMPANHHTRRSMVNGCSRPGRAAFTFITPGVWPKRKKRDRRRLSAS